MRWFCASAVAATLLAGCSTAKTIVVVSVSGQVDGITQLVVNLAAGGLASTIYVPEKPEPIALPTDFTIEMDRSRTGELRIDIDAINGDGQRVASGSAVIDDVVVGETNTVPVELFALMVPPPPDGGSEDDAGTTDTGATDDAGEPDPDAATAEETAP